MMVVQSNRALVLAWEESTRGKTGPARHRFPQGQRPFRFAAFLVWDQFSFFRESSYFNYAQNQGPISAPITAPARVIDEGPFDATPVRLP